MDRLTMVSGAVSATQPTRNYRDVWRAYIGVGIGCVVFYSVLALSYVAGPTALGSVGRALIYSLVQILYLFAFPMMLLSLAVDPQVVLHGQPWLALPQLLASVAWLGAFAWIAHRQPTARRRTALALFLGLWVLAVPLLQAIQLWTPIATDELFGL